LQQRHIFGALRLLLWVNHAILVAGRLLPVFLWIRTPSRPVGMSQKCQRTTLRMHPAQKKSRPKAALNFSPKII